MGIIECTRTKQLTNDDLEEIAHFMSAQWVRKRPCLERSGIPVLTRALG